MLPQGAFLYFSSMNDIDMSWGPIYIACQIPYTKFLV